jgi:hypothetical protein
LGAIFTFADDKLESILGMITKASPGTTAQIEQYATERERTGKPEIGTSSEVWHDGDLDIVLTKHDPRNGMTDENYGFSGFDRGSR